MGERRTIIFYTEDIFKDPKALHCLN